MFPEGEPISENAGRMIAEWAHGGKPDLDPIDEYAKEVGAKLKSASFAELSEWWSETEARRDALKIPADRLDKMNQAVAKALEAN